VSAKKEKLLRKLSVAQKVDWTPFTERMPPPGLDGSGIQFFRNSRYQVNITKFLIDPPFGKCLHLSIKTLDKSTYRDWRDYQRIKNELVGPEYEAVELYPAESRLMDTSNQYHMWCFPEFKFPFGYKYREVCEDTGDTGAEQRPFELKPTDLIVPKLDDVLFKTYEEMYLGKKVG